MSAGLSAADWRRVGELFHSALELPEAERVAFAERESQGDPEVLREVLSLIESDRKAAAQAFVEGRVKAGILSFGAPAAKPPARVGPYRLVRLIGRGGMGAVYLGQRDDEQYNINVAVKIVSPGMDTEFVLKRFRRERQTLANLQHPNIARLLDGGTTDEGMPYIVMEFVDGPHITGYCHAHAASIEVRLRLFLDVCSAVIHAHRNFVVHRDIKPGNILVDQAGVPKLLDFGICKLLYSELAGGDQTVDQGARMMTPDYAAPEQVRGENATITSDVYSLGAVLYELLAEAKPHRFSNYSVQEIERVICTVEPEKPSAVAANKTLSRRLAGDLDTIVMRSLAKDPERRYETVEHLAADIRRYLAHEPLLARPDTIFYRTGKFVRRRAGFVAAAAAVIVSLVAGLTAAAHQARLANERFLQVRKLANVFVSDVHDAVRPLAGSTQARNLILRTGLEYLDALAASAGSDTGLQAELAASYIKIGDLQGDDTTANLGQIEQAFSSYEKARKLLDAALSRNPADPAIRKQSFILALQTGRLKYVQRDRAGALAAFGRAATEGERLLTADPQNEDLRERLAQAYAETGLTYRSTGEAKATMDALVKASVLLDGAPQARKSDPQFEFLAASGESQRGTAEVMAGQVSTGLAHLRSAAGWLDELCSRFPENTDFARQAMLTWSHNADTLNDQKNMSGAYAAGQRFLAIARRLREADAHDDRAANDYAIALMKVAAFVPEAEAARRIELLRPAVVILQARVAANPKNAQSGVFLASAEARLGDSLRDSRDLSEAQRLWISAMQHAEPLIDSGQLAPAEVYVMACTRLGEAAAVRHDRQQAENYSGQAWRMADPQGGLSSKRTPMQQRLLTARGQVAVGMIRSRLGDRDEAIAWLRKALSNWQSLKSEPVFNPTYQRLLDAAQTELARIGGAH